MLMGETLAQYNVEEMVDSVQTTMRPLSKDLPKRVRQPESLQRDVLFKELSSQEVSSTMVELPDGNFRMINTYNVISPYTSLDHVMILDGSCDYTPTPTEIPVGEYAAFFKVAKVVYDKMKNDQPDSVISIGYNNTPLNFGDQEMNGGGMQSLPTKHHLQMWNRPSDLSQRPLSSLPENVQEFIKGDPFNAYAMKILRRHLEHEDLIDPESIQISNQGLKAKLRLSVDESLQNADTFAGKIKSFHAKIEAVNRAIWNALVESPINGLDAFDAGKALAQDAFENEYSEKHLQYLETPPRLLPVEERRQRIQSLPGDLFTDLEKQSLLRLNGYLKNRDEVPTYSDQDPTKFQIRKGMGYSLVFVDNLKTNESTLYLRPAIRIATSRGGVVEAQNISLQRSTDAGTSDEAIRENTKHMKALSDAVPSFLRR